MGMEVTINLVNVGIFAGYLLVIFGVLSLFSPKAMLKINTWANKFLMGLDEGTLTHRIPSGITSLLLGSIILFIIFKFR